MARFNPNHNSEPVHDAAAAWGKRCLVDNDSVFKDDVKLWTPDLLDELDRRFVQNIDEGEGNFFEKLKSQLGSGTAQCRKLMAEMLWILMLFQSNVTAGKKRENVRQVWSWSGAELPANHPMLADLVLEGLGSTGTAYNTYRWRELSFLIATMREIKRLETADRHALLQDGWTFADWLSGRPGAPNRQLPHILTHLLFPDLFERISSPKDKRFILAAFGDTSEKDLRSWNAPAIDRALLDLRRRFEKERGGDIDFYEAEFAKDWRGSIRSWLLSWNPEKWEWTTLAVDRAKTRSGEMVTHSWRCASTAPREGDHVYLLRTGFDPKGIVAFGTVARAPYDALHYCPTSALVRQI